MKIYFIQPLLLTPIIAISILTSSSLNCMLVNDLGEIRGATDGDKKAYQLYLNYDEPLAISQSPFNCDNYSEDLLAKSAPQISAWEEKIVKLVDASEQSTPSPATEGNFARVKEIEDQLKTAIPQELLDILRKSAVVSSARLPYINCDRYKANFKPNFRILMREVLVHAIYATTQAGKLKETALTKKQEELKKEFTSLALQEREQDAQIDALQKQLESMKVLLSSKKPAPQDPKTPNTIKETDTNSETPHEEQAQVPVQFYQLNENNYQVSTSLANSAEEQEQNTQIAASPKPLEKKTLLSAKAPTAQDQKKPYPSYLHALLYGKANNKE